jgi:hypothetical protein
MDEWTDMDDVDEWTDEWMDGQWMMDEWTDGWTDTDGYGWMDTNGMDDG